jgi:hypothetical protein
MFKLVSSETKPLTPQLAEEFMNLPASPTERLFDEGRARMLREKAEAGQLIAFQWAKAKHGDKVFRMNGQHSSKVLVDLNGSFPEGLNVHLDTYEVETQDDLANLFRQFDNRKSGRTPGDVAGAYQGLQPALEGVSRPSAKIAVEGVNWWYRYVEGAPAKKGDDTYSLFGDTRLHPFIGWVGDVFSIKTPELKRQTVVAAMFGTFEANEEEAKKFWAEVSRGGVEFEENHPTTVLDAFLKALIEDKRKLDLKPANLYQASVYAWNAYREEKTISSIKWDTKKGFYQVAA